MKRYETASSSPHRLFIRALVALILLTCLPDVASAQAQSWVEVATLTSRPVCGGRPAPADELDRPADSLTDGSALGGGAVLAHDPAPVDAREGGGEPARAGAEDAGADADAALAVGALAAAASKEIGLSASAPAPASAAA